jgi:hypothetical protein
MHQTTTPVGPTFHARRNCVHLARATSIPLTVLTREAYRHDHRTRPAVQARRTDQPRQPRREAGRLLRATGAISLLRTRTEDCVLLRRGDRGRLLRLPLIGGQVCSPPSTVGSRWRMQLVNTTSTRAGCFAPPRARGSPLASAGTVCRDHCIDHGPAGSAGGGVPDADVAPNSRWWVRLAAIEDSGPNSILLKPVCPDPSPSARVGP